MNNNECTVCNEGSFTELQEIKEITYKRITGRITLYYNECQSCGCSHINSKQRAINKESVDRFKFEVDSLLKDNYEMFSMSPITKHFIK